jgi:hypothetical protein
LNYKIWINILTINEIKAFDSKSSGNTQVAIIDKDGFKSLPRKRIVELYSRYREAIAGGVAKQLRIEK